MLSILRRLLGNGPSGNIARKRMQFVLMHDRVDITPDMMEAVKNDIIKVLSRYMEIDNRSIKVDLEQGGDFMALACAEYQFPIFEKTFNGVLFFDSGTVEKDITIKTWRASVGFGIRFIVPFFGPVPFSFDFGFPIAKATEDKTQIFSFSIGTAF